MKVFCCNIFPLLHLTSQQVKSSALHSAIFNDNEMEVRGENWAVMGCRKRKKKKEEGNRSDSDGSSDEESHERRLFPWTFHE